jgi:uncharacterized protein YkwD
VSVLRRLLIAPLLAALLLAPDAAAAERCSGADSRPSTARLSTVERATLCLLNRERTTRGRMALRSNRQLHDAAVRHSRDMAQRDYFGHNTLGGRDWDDRIRRAGYSFTVVGENIAWGAGRNSTPRAIVRAWMRSTKHRANILGREFRDIGVGIARGAPAAGVSNAAVYTTDFGAR